MPLSPSAFLLSAGDNSFPSAHKDLAVRLPISALFDALWLRGTKDTVGEGGSSVWGHCPGTTLLNWLNK